eukprot:4635219-Pleurochrysis_carterae.AAC.3
MQRTVRVDMTTIGARAGERGFARCAPHGAPCAVRGHARARTHARTHGGRRRILCSLDYT